ncbi:MAG: ribonuclease E/G [Inquilinaceae bacterium]
MGTVEIHVSGAGGVLLAGVAEDGRLTDLLADRPDRSGLDGAIYQGRVARIDAKAGLAFLDLGFERPALLPMRRAGPRVPGAGETVLVQIVAAPRADKGAEATLDVALPGRYLVHRPLTDRLSVSRALGAETRQAWRDRLSGGWSVRGAAASVPVDVVMAEAERLTTAWRAIQDRAEPAAEPRLLAPGLDPAQRLILDRPEAASVRVADPAQRRALDRWLRTWAPDALDRLKDAPVDLFDLVPDLLEPSVMLPSGGWLHIEPTRALTAIDVDAASARDRVRANREAAVEAPRQIRLRNIGGVAVIDFITAGRGETAAGLPALVRRGFQGDRADVRLATAVSPLGLFELARQRRGRSLAEVMAPQVSRVIAGAPMARTDGTR